MKLFAFILSVYILILAEIPCIDLPDDHSIQKIEFSKVPAGDQQRGDDHCSPFCSCYCCTTPLILQDQRIQFDCYSFSQKQHTIYTSAYNSSFSASIWQPPKTS